MKKYYLAYGSNLNLEHMKKRCPFSKPVGKVLIKGYKLVYKGADDGVAFLTIEKDENGSIPMGLFEVSILDICYLDMYEGYPSLYKKEHFNITYNGRKKRALIYVMNDEFDYHIPTDNYIATCEAGYRDFGFDIEYLSNAYYDTREQVNQKKLVKEKDTFK